ncbi:cytochrome c peroxidase [Niabella terrae]
MMQRKIIVLAWVLAGMLIAGFTTFRSDPLQGNDAGFREKKIRQQVLRDLQSFHRYVQDSLGKTGEETASDTVALRRMFLEARLKFKKFEWAAAYFAADLTQRLNGPPVEEIENQDLLDPVMARGIDPTGLQVIEAYLYPSFETENAASLREEIGRLQQNTDYLRAYFTDLELADWRILDAAKLEIFRIITLGITGFDNPMARNSMQEAAVALGSLRELLVYYLPHRSSASLLQKIDGAIDYLMMHRNFDLFDRAAFITRYANEISSNIAQLTEILPGPKIRYNRMLRQDVRTLFDEDAFNVNAFTPGPAFHMTAAKVSLGRKLFYDPALSGTGTRSCASCHRPELAFTDGLLTPRDLLDSSRHLTRNAPTLLNAALQSNYFYDLRALTLEDQALDVICNPEEMNGSMENIIDYINGNPGYRTLVTRAFPEDTQQGFSSSQLTNALASYVRSLTRLDSRFDDYMRGSTASLTQQEIRGFNLFMGKAKCATCHFMPLFNGVTPPKYVRSESEVLGVPVSRSDSTLDPDAGYFDIIGIDSYQHAFKIPTVRNISKTAPYMHNGVYNNLEQVMEFYNNAGAVGLKILLPNQTLPADPLQLTPEEITAVIAFLKSLDSAPVR